MYYLNALELLEVSNIKYAKRICVAGCPGSADVCNRTSLPCSADNNYRCGLLGGSRGTCFGVACLLLRASQLALC